MITIRSFHESLLRTFGMLHAESPLDLVVRMVVAFALSLFVLTCLIQIFR